MKAGEIWKSKNANPYYRVRILELGEDSNNEWVAYLIHENDIEKFKEVVLQFSGISESFLNTMAKHGTVLSRDVFVKIFEKCYE